MANIGNFTNNNSQSGNLTGASGTGGTTTTQSAATFDPACCPPTYTPCKDTRVSVSIYNLANLAVPLITFTSIPPTDAQLAVGVYVNSLPSGTRVSAVYTVCCYDTNPAYCTNETKELIAQTDSCNTTTACPEGQIAVNGVCKPICICGNENSCNCHPGDCRKHPEIEGVCYCQTYTCPEGYTLANDGSCKPPCVDICCPEGQIAVLQRNNTCACKPICICNSPIACNGNPNNCKPHPHLAGVCICDSCLPTACVQNTDCVNYPNCVCINNVCVSNPCANVVCTTNSDCGVGCTCVNGNCEPINCDGSLCTQNIDCVGYPNCLCINGICTTNPCANVTCVTNTDCGQGCTCVNGVCQPIICDNAVCVESTDCEGYPNCTCIDGHCVPNPCASVTCNTNADCGLGCICINGLCVPINCDNAVCVQNTDCDSYPYCACVNGHCVPNPCASITCTTNADCGVGCICVNGNCEPIICSELDCVQNTDCENYPYCVCITGECRSNPCASVTCNTNADCGLGCICVNGNCEPIICHIAVCVESTDCEGYPNCTCIDGFCVPNPCAGVTCNTNADCGLGCECIGGFCQPTGPCSAALFCPKLIYTLTPGGISINGVTNACRNNDAVLQYTITFIPLNLGNSPVTFTYPIVNDPSNPNPINPPYFVPLQSGSYSYIISDIHTVFSNQNGCVIENVHGVIDGITPLVCCQQVGGSFSGGQAGVWVDVEVEAPAGWDGVSEVLAYIDLSTIVVVDRMEAYQNGILLAQSPYIGTVSPISGLTVQGYWNNAATPGSAATPYIYSVGTPGVPSGPLPVNFTLPVQNTTGNGRLFYKYAPDPITKKALIKVHVQGNPINPGTVWYMQPSCGVALDCTACGSTLPVGECTPSNCCLEATTNNYCSDSVVSTTIFNAVDFSVDWTYIAPSYTGVYTANPGTTNADWTAFVNAVTNMLNTCSGKFITLGNIDYWKDAITITFDNVNKVMTIVYNTNNDNNAVSQCEQSEIDNTITALNSFVSLGSFGVLYTTVRCKNRTTAFTIAVNDCAGQDVVVTNYNWQIPNTITVVLGGTNTTAYVHYLGAGTITVTATVDGCTNTITESYNNEI